MQRTIKFKLNTPWSLVALALAGWGLIDLSVKTYQIVSPTVYSWF